MSWLIFALFPPFIFSINGFINKILVNQIKNPLIITAFMGIISLFLGVILLAFTGFTIIPIRDLAIILFSGLMLNFYLLPYFRALMLDDNSRIAPFFQLITVFTILMSYLFLGEYLTSQQSIGVLVIVVGAFLLSMKNLELGVLMPRKSLWLMALSSLMYAITNVTFKEVSIHQPHVTTFAYQSIGIGIGALLMLVSKPLSTTLRADIKKFTPLVWLLLAAVTTISITAQLSLSYALTLAPASFVSIAGASQPFFVLCIGILLSVLAPAILKEDMKRSTLIIKAVSIGIMFFGIYLVYS